MNETPASYPSRKSIAIRFLYTILYLIIFEILKFLIQVICLVQYVYLFITRKHLEPARRFANRAAAYAYRVIRYLTLNENLRPFPCGEFPGELETPEEQVRFE
jgi:predicted membrane protein